MSSSGSICGARPATGRPSSRPGDGRELGYDHLWTWDHLLAIFGDPDQPIFEGYTALAALGPGDRAGAARSARRGEHLPQPGLTAKPRHDRPHQRRPGDHGPRRSVVRARARGLRLDFGSGFGQRLDWLAEAVPPSGRCSMAARSPARRRPLCIRPSADRAAAGPAPPATDDRRGRRAEDAPDRGRACRHVECVRDSRDAGPQGRGPARPLRGCRPRPVRDRTIRRLQDHHPPDRGRGKTGPLPSSSTTARRPPEWTATCRSGPARPSRSPRR